MLDLEIDLEKKIVNFLLKEGHIADSQDATLNRFNKPDIIAGINGIYVAMEVKRKNKPARITKGQIAYLDKVNKTGGIGRRVDKMEDVYEIIKETEKMRVKV